MLKLGSPVESWSALATIHLILASTDDPDPVRRANVSHEVWCDPGRGLGDRDLAICTQ
jgi:hypothetical protein